MKVLKFLEEVGLGMRNNLLDFGCDLRPDSGPGILFLICLDIA